MRKVIASTLILAFALAIPGSSHPAQAARAKNEIRIATLAPRNTDLTRGFNKIDQALRKATGGEWGIRLYPSGVAGDEKDVIRKMRVGQMDASIVTTTGLSQIVREVAVLNAPGVIPGYKELERVQKAMSKEWEKTFRENGFELVSWGESGQYRYFSNAPITNIKTDMPKMRPWLWPESHVMKEIYNAVGAHGVPLGVPEVYGALQTKMIDSLISTSLATVALQWHSKLNHVTSETSGVLLGAMIVNKKKWDSIPEDVRKTLDEQIRKNTEGDSKTVRKNDLKSYKKLLKRGYTATKYTAQGQKEWDAMADTVRKRMTGRVFPKSLLDKVQKIAQGG
jgi:TRAP-type C4-dicarboxylate transport system substrate-binding protein